jgi:DNA-binding GntR family transcriptional regulator
MPRKKKTTPNTSRRADAYERILLAIILGELEGGAKLDERHLVKDYKLGQAAVRDALFRLALEGLVERHARVGTRVADLSLKALQDVFETRIVIESYAAALAAERATPEDIAAIRATHEGHAAAVKARDVRQLVLIDMAFHGAIAKACRNAEIERTLIRLHNSAARFWCLGLNRTSEEDMLRQGKAHLAIVDAIETRDFAEIERRVHAVMGYVPDPRFFVNEPLVAVKLFSDPDPAPGAAANEQSVSALPRFRKAAIG